LVYAIHALDRTVINVLIEPIRVEFGVSDSALGFLTGAAHSIPFAFAALPIGALIDRVRRDRLLAGLVLPARSRDPKQVDRQSLYDGAEI